MWQTSNRACRLFTSGVSRPSALCPSPSGRASPHLGAVHTTSRRKHSRQLRCVTAIDTRSPGHPARQEPSAAPADARKGGAILEDALGGVSEPNGVCGLRRLRAAARALRGRVQLPASAPGHRRDGARRPLLPVGAAGARSDREDDCRERAAARARAAGAQALLLGRPARRPGSDDRGRRQRAARADGQRTARDDPFTEGGSR